MSETISLNKEPEVSCGDPLYESLRWSVKAAEENAAHHAKLATYPGSTEIQRQSATYSLGYADGLRAALDCCLWMTGLDTRAQPDPSTARP